MFRPKSVNLFRPKYVNLPVDGPRYSLYNRMYGLKAPVLLIHIVTVGEHLCHKRGNHDI